MFPFHSSAWDDAVVEIFRRRPTCDACTIASIEGAWNRVLAMIRLERSMDSIGFMLRCTTVFITVLSKRWMAPITMCTSAFSMGSAPDRVRASSMSKTAWRSLLRSSDDNCSVLGLSLLRINAFWRARCHWSPGLMIAGRTAWSSSKRSKASSSLEGNFV